MFGNWLETTCNAIASPILNQIFKPYKTALDSALKDPKQQKLLQDTTRILDADHNHTITYNEVYNQGEQFVKIADQEEAFLWEALRNKTPIPAEYGTITPYHCENSASKRCYVLTPKHKATHNAIAQTFLDAKNHTNGHSPETLGKDLQKFTPEQLADYIGYTQYLRTEVPELFADHALLRGCALKAVTNFGVDTINDMLGKLSPTPPKIDANYAKDMMQAADAAAKARKAQVASK